jgi:signal transduction histidine kinase/ABC-type uncharacterized transport system substrate-binding protein
MSTCYNNEAVYAEDNEIKDVLIINSYHSGLSWTDEMTNGIIDSLSNSKVNCSIAVEYMDWKNYPTKENLDNFYTNISYKYSKKQIDIIITTDDAALEFAIKHREDLFQNAPIVFCGVNDKGVKKLTTGVAKVTGVTEIVDADRTIKAALTMIPVLKEIVVIFDNTESGISTGELTIDEIHRLAPDIKVVALHEGSYRDIINKVSQLPKDSTVLVTTYYEDDMGYMIGFEKFTELLNEVSQVPIFHLYEFGLDHGAIGGSVLSGKNQGETAGNLAAEVLNGVQITNLPIIRTNTTNYIFDYNLVKHFSISMDNIPKGSQIINEPFSFIETYRDLVVSTIIIFSLLVIFIFVLMIYLRKISRMKQKLYASNVELTELYEDLTASDEELRQQYDELTQMQNNLLASEERYVQLFDKMLNGFFVFDPVFNKENKLVDLRFITINPSVEKYFNMDANRIIGRTWHEIFAEDNIDLKRFEKVLITGEAERFETFYPANKSFYLVNAFLAKNNQVGVVLDNITDYKRAIEEIGKLNEELEHRVIERTNDLQIALKELEAFTYTVSHDLKSPLRAIDGYIKITQEDYEDKLDEETKTMLSNIRSICKEMIDMIQKLLQYSTTSRMELSPETVDTNELIAAVFHEIKTCITNRRIELQIETGLPSVIADRVLLKQALANILLNAVKFTKDREEAIIKVGATITENEYIFYFQDNGVGIDMQYSGKLFGIFQRLHTSDEFEGSGIGLVTIKKIIEKHGGRTWIEGAVNVGATLYFTLPIKWNPEANES